VEERKETLMHGGTLEDLVALVLLALMALAGLALVVGYVVSIVWAYGDAERRGKSGCLVAILVALVSWPLGLLIWLIARPEDRPPPA
jgi:hypothetical protein